MFWTKKQLAFCFLVAAGPIPIHISDAPAASHQPGTLATECDTLQTRDWRARLSRWPPRSGQLAAGDGFKIPGSKNSPACMYSNSLPMRNLT